MNAPLVRVTCASCPRIVGRVDRDRVYRSSAPNGPDDFISGWEATVSHLRRLREKTGKRPPPVMSRYELPIDHADADDFGDAFPTYCGACDIRSAVDRQRLVIAADEATGAQGAAQVVRANV